MKIYVQKELESHKFSDRRHLQRTPKQTKKMFRSLGFFSHSVRYYALTNKIRPFRKPEVVKKIESAAISLKAKG